MKKLAYLLILAFMVNLNLLSTSQPETQAAVHSPTGRMPVPKMPDGEIAKFLGPEIAISERVSDEYSPAIAYNSVHDQYLVVWENIWPGGHHDIYAQRISGDGRLLTWFAVASGSHKQMEPAVAYDPVYDRYLVVWTYDTPGDSSNWDVYGRFSPWSGPDDNLTDFPLCDTTGNVGHPSVAYALTQQQFMVAWAEYPSGLASYIRARRVFAAGGFPDPPFSISNGLENRDRPDVAYNLTYNQFLVTWMVYKGSKSWDIYGLRYAAMGYVMPGGDPRVVGEFIISSFSAREERPSVAACYYPNQYLVAWQSDEDTSGANYAIYARYLTGDADPGSIFKVSSTTLSSQEVDVDCDASGQKYMLTWQVLFVNPVFAIFARQVYPNGSTGPEFGVVNPGPTSGRQYPAVAGGQSSYLVVWEHIREAVGNLDIHGRLLRYANFLPVIAK